MTHQRLLRTGQRRCYDSGGHEIPCAGSTQDAEHVVGPPWPEPRFAVAGEVVTDRLTSLIWTIDANPAAFPVGWREACEARAAMNRDGAFGHRGWRVPNRRELLSLLDHEEARPALPAGHPFRNLFQGWYWTSTTAAINPAYALYVHLAVARMFYGEKQRFALLWPVCGETEVCLRTGQERCFDEAGAPAPCRGTGQDGELRLGRPWPDPRFRAAENEYQEALRLDPTDAEVHYNLGLSLENGGRKTESQAEYREALRINPLHKRARERRRVLER